MFFFVAVKLRLEKENEKKEKLSSSCYVIRFAGIRDDVTMALLAIVYVVCKFVALCYILPASWLCISMALIAFIYVSTIDE
jgi:hypothetical protein